MAVTVRPVRPEDFAAFFDKPPPVRVRGYAGVDGDEVVAVGGIACCGDGVFQAFFDVKDGDLRKQYPVTLYKAARRLLADAQSWGIPRVVAFPSANVEAAERFLRRLGFAPLDDGEMYVWSAG
ncbi:MAG: hypothetical protein RL477_1544 [Pseudomonadota bacterium]